MTNLHPIHRPWAHGVYMEVGLSKRNVIGAPSDTKILQY